MSQGLQARLGKTEVKLNCHCGAFRARLEKVSPCSGTRCICYCDDCQAFAHHMGCAEAVLDQYGGTEIFQTNPGRFRITKGTENLACVNLTGGSTYRWFASCCNTPIGSTLGTPKVPFVSLIRNNFDLAEGNEALNARMGPIRGRVKTRFARGLPKDLVQRDMPVSIVLRFLVLILRGVVSRDSRKTPFFKYPGGAPIAEQHVLTEAERKAAYSYGEMSIAGRKENKLGKK